MKKKTFVFLLTIILFLSMVAPAFAADYGAWSDWSTQRPASVSGRQIEARSTVVGYNMVT